MNWITLIFVVGLMTSVLIQLWLDLRQIRYVRQHRDTVPDAFKDKISLVAHQKAADYTIARARLGIVELYFGSILLLAWTLGGGLQLLDTAWRHSPLTSPLLNGVGVLLSVLLISAVLDLPVTLYRTFVIEQRFGFNRITPGVFITDLAKQLLLLLILGVPLVTLVLWLMLDASSLWWLYVWGVWMGFSLFLLWAWPAFIAPLFNKFIPLDNVELKQRIENLLDRCGFKSNGVFVMDGSKRSSHGNAYFSGLGTNKRIVFFDTLLKSLDADEVEAVLAHELGHFKHKHIQKRIITMAGLSLTGLAILALLMRLPEFYYGLGVSTPSTYMALALFMMVMPIFSFYLQPVMAWLSRKHEFEADNYAMQQSNATTLIQALVKLYKENASTLTPDPLYSAFHDSHPPAPVRIRHLSRKLGNNL
ncbi:MAG: M48 family metallopeptidase [Proteobacteria bacterium]|nr:M48 family metallopeptidase [Pseudomonadota bacterium]